MIGNEQRSKTTRAIEQATGTKFCYTCNIHRPMEGGGYVQIKNSKRFKCKHCYERLMARKG